MNTTMTTKVKKKELSLWNQCQKQAALLDEKIPGWHMGIDPSHLDMDSRTHCIVGQCPFFKKYVEISLERRQLQRIGLDPKLFGYHTLLEEKMNEGYEGWRDLHKACHKIKRINKQLTRYWKTLIRQRQGYSQE